MRIYCKTCGYDLVGSLSQKHCPECGRRFDPSVPGTFFRSPSGVLTRAFWIYVVCYAAVACYMESSFRLWHSRILELKSLTFAFWDGLAPEPDYAYLDAIDDASAIIIWPSSVALIVLLTLSVRWAAANLRSSKRLAVIAAAFAASFLLAFRLLYFGALFGALGD